MTSLSCNLCGGALTTRLPHVPDPQTREIFTIAECGKCRLGHTIPQPENLTRYYGATYHGGRHGLTADYCANRRLGFVESLSSAGDGRRLLDVGCGDGTFLLAARRRGWETTGTEMNPEIARSFQLDVRENIEDTRSFGPFDCITLWHSLEHMRDPRKDITTLTSMLRDEGVMLIAVPNFSGLQARLFGAHWLHLDVPRHLYHFSDRSLMMLLDQAGLTTVRRWDQEFEYDLMGWSQSALNTFMREPNVFFKVLSGKPADVTTTSKILNSGLGVLLSGLALPAVLVGTLIDRGGTLIIGARKKSD